MATPRGHQNSPQATGEGQAAQDTPIEPLRQDEAREEDEFLTTGWDATSTVASTSLASSVYKYEFENGRRYHSYKHGRYPIPNDDIEQNREDMKHAMIMELTDGKLFYSPIGDNPQKILDLGTGTGIWAMEVADSFPGAEVLGIDLSPIQPTWVPPNLRFIVDDVEDEWVNGSDWDFVHCRSMAVVLRNLDKVLNQTFTHVKPGGWIEFQESHGMPQCDDGTMKQDDVLANFYSACVEAMAKFGMDLDKGSAPLGAVLEAAGFTNVRCVVKKAPLGTWARNKTLRLVGQYAKLALLDSLSSVMGKPFAALGYSEEEREVWAAKIRQAANDDSVHRYYNVYFWYGQKPE